MTFRSIQDLAISVLAKLDIQATEEGCASEAHSLRPATGKRVATDAQREGKASVAFAQSGDKGTAEQTGMRKMAEPGDPAKLGGQEERQSEDSRGRISEVNRSLSYRKPTLTVLPVSKRMKVARPTGVAPRHAAFIRLVTVNGHAIHPIA